MKFLEKGHTFMRADAIHGAIGRKMKKMENIHTYDDFVEVCGSAASRNRPIPLHYGDFYQFVDGHRSRQTKKETIPQFQRLNSRRGVKICITSRVFKTKTTPSATS